MCGVGVGVVCGCVVCVCSVWVCGVGVVCGCMCCVGRMGVQSELLLNIIANAWPIIKLNPLN